MVGNIGSDTVDGLPVRANIFINIKSTPFCFILSILNGPVTAKSVTSYFTKYCYISSCTVSIQK